MSKASSTVDNNISLMNPNIVNSKCKRRSGNRSIDETSNKTSRCVKINNDNKANCEQSEDVTVSSIYVEKGLKNDSTARRACLGRSSVGQQ